MQICPFYRVRQSVILQFIAESFVLERASLHFLGWRRTRKVFFRFEVCLWVKGQLAAKFNAGNCIYKLLKFPTTFTFSCMISLLFSPNHTKMYPWWHIIGLLGFIGNMVSISN
jgi:hypothetical protein